MFPLTVCQSLERNYYSCFLLHSAVLPSVITLYLFSGAERRKPFVFLPWKHKGEVLCLHSAANILMIYGEICVMVGSQNILVHFGRWMWWLRLKSYYSTEPTVNSNTHFLFKISFRTTAPGSRLFKSMFCLELNSMLIATLTGCCLSFRQQHQEVALQHSP